MLIEKDIPKLTSSAPYRVDVSLDFLLEHLARFKRRGLDLNPEFQRGHVWTPDLKIKWIIRVRRPDGDDTTQYSSNCGNPVTAEHVRRSPSVCAWIAGARLISISPANSASNPPTC